MAGLVNNLLILFLIFQNSCLAFRSPLSVFKRWVVYQCALLSVAVCFSLICVVGLKVKLPAK